MTHGRLVAAFVAAILAAPLGADAQMVTPVASYPYTNYVQLAVGLLTNPPVTTGGASYVTNDSVTFATTGGICSVAPVATVTAAAGVVSAVTVTTPGVCTQPPPSPLTQASTTGIGTGLTVTVNGLGWTGNWTALASQVLVQIVGAGGGSGAVSGAAAATTAGASSGGWADVIMTLTSGASIAYSLGQPGLGGASGGANTGTNGSASVFNALSVTGGKATAGTTNSNGAASGFLFSPPGAAPTATQHIIASGIQIGTAGSGGTGGTGGGTPAGAGPTGTANAAGNVGTGGYGAGGSGAGDTSTVTHAGANGTGGGIWVRW